MSIHVGRHGVWATYLVLTPELAAEIETLGFDAVWIGGASADLDLAVRILDATEHLVVGTSIVNMWQTTAAEAAEFYHRVAARHADRFLLGVGVGHPEFTAEYRSPLDTIVGYLDELDAAGVPVEGRALAALGPRVLRIAGERTAGALPYLTTPVHTAEARSILGPDALLVAEHKVVVTEDAAHARTVGRPKVRDPYLGFTNYRRNLTRGTGFTVEDLDTASDRLIDALVLHGSPATVAAGLEQHLAAGADHIAVQPLSESGAADEDYRRTLRVLAETLRTE